MSDKTPRIPGIQILTPEEDRGYAFNRHLELGLRQENTRLRKALAERNRQFQALVEKYRSYDEERKAYYAAFEEEYADMKESFDSFNEELLKVSDDGTFRDGERKSILRLFRNWYTYKKNAAYYHDRLASGRKAVKGIEKDVESIRELIRKDPDTEVITAICERSAVLQTHLDALLAAIET